MAANRLFDSAKRDPLQVIPGVGPSTSRAFHQLGIFHPADLIGQDPEQLYQRLIDVRNEHVDRCVLYVFRCAVYFSETERPEPELLDWWNWKDPTP